MVGPSERDPQDPPRTPSLADPTRDIRLPPLPGRSGPEVPPEWEALRAEPAPAAPPDTLADQPTDQLGQPPQGVRDRTLTFSGTAVQRWAAGHPATPNPAWSSVPPEPSPVVVGPRPRAVDERSRRWPWVLLVLLPVLVIGVTGVWLLVLMQGG